MFFKTHLKLLYRTIQGMRAIQVDGLVYVSIPNLVLKLDLTFSKMYYIAKFSDVQMINICWSLILKLIWQPKLNTKWRRGAVHLSISFKILMVVIVVYCKILYNKNKIEAISHTGVILELKAECGRNPSPSWPDRRC